MLFDMVQIFAGRVGKHPQWTPHVVLPEREMGDVDAGRTGTTCRGGGSFGVIGGGGSGGEGTSMGSFANIEGGFDFDGGHFHGRQAK